MVATFGSDLPERLVTAAGEQRDRRKASYLFGVWVGIGAISSIAAGAILAMLADTMVPEALEPTHLHTGSVAAVGFTVSFGVERLG